MKTKEQIEMAAEIIGEQHLALLRSSEYVEGQIVALRWVLGQGTWPEIGEKTREARKGAVKDRLLLSGPEVS